MRAISPANSTARLWSAADGVLLVTSPDAVAVMDTYALIKTLLSRHALRQPLALVVNQADRRSDRGSMFIAASINRAGGFWACRLNSPAACLTTPPMRAGADRNRHSPLSQRVAGTTRQQQLLDDSHADGCSR